MYVYMMSTHTNARISACTVPCSRTAGEAQEKAVQGDETRRDQHRYEPRRVEPTQIVSVVATVHLGEGSLQIVYRTPDGAMKERLLVWRTELPVSGGGGPCGEQI